MSFHTLYRIADDIATYFGNLENGLCDLRITPSTIL